MFYLCSKSGQQPCDNADKYIAVDLHKSSMQQRDVTMEQNRNTTPPLLNKC